MNQSASASLHVGSGDEERDRSGGGAGVVVDFSQPKTDTGNVAKEDA
jgi:hypothetical protein